VSCSHAAKGRSWRRCACPVWVAGTLGGQRIRRSLDLTSWEAAARKVLRWETTGQILEHEPVADGVTVTDAINSFLADARARNLSEGTLKKYQVLLRRPSVPDPNRNRQRSASLEEFASEKGIQNIAGLNTELLREFRAGWADGPLSGHKKLERLKAFFRFVAESDWIENNPAQVIKAPTMKAEPPTMPFDDAELERLHETIAALRKQEGGRAAAHSNHLGRLPVLLRLMEYSGLRIGDACNLSKTDVEGNRLFLNTQKSGTRVYVPLPKWLVDDMNELSLYRGRYYFWRGTGKIATAAGNYRRTLRAIANEAGIRDAHPHRLRDTFAIRLLREGVPIERVSKLLGHQSIAITERHYAPWVKSLQDQLEKDVARVWARNDSGKPERKRLRRVK